MLCCGSVSNNSVNEKQQASRQPEFSPLKLKEIMTVYGYFQQL